MKKNLIFSCPLLFANLIPMAAIETGHTPCGVLYSEQSLKAYISYRHGPDGNLFLDPFLYESLLHLEGKKVLDAGCGAAPWSIIAAKNGASVWGIDIQNKMIDQAQNAVKSAGVSDKVILSQGDVSALPFGEAFFDAILSINVGCNLPGTTFIYSEEGPRRVGLGSHLQEMTRVLKEGGTVLITAPTSFEVVFTNGTVSDEEVKGRIESALASIGSSKDPELITSHLNELSEIYRATFVHREDKLVLVTDEKQLKTGEPIWRKIPGLVMPAHYHSEEEYLAAFKESGLAIEKIYRPCFKDECEWQRYLETHPKKNEKLSQAYIQNPPFVIYLLRKK